MSPRKKSKRITKPANVTSANMSTSQSFWPRIEAAKILGLETRDEMFAALDLIENQRDQDNTRYMMNYFINSMGGLSKYKYWRQKQDDKANGVYT